MKDFTNLIKTLKNNKKKTDQYFEESINELIKQQNELKEWRKVSGCNTLYNFKKKKNNENLLLEQNKKYKEVSQCNSPEKLQKKLNKYVQNEQQINNWMNTLGVKTISGLNTVIMDFGSNNKYSNDPRIKVYNLYIKWVEEKNLFDYERTYMFFYSIFKKEKNRLIDALYENKENLSEYNTWNLAEFFIFMYEMGYEDPDILLNNLTIKEINKLKDAKNESFDPYDINNTWYNKQRPSVKEYLDKEKRRLGL